LIRPSIERYLRALRQHHIRAQEVYLYGSYARGSADADSDIDLAIVSDDLTGHRIEDQMTLIRLTWDVDLRIEPHPDRPQDFRPDDPEDQEILETRLRIN
jgi:predicted nucleotidyltransferase